MKIETVKKTEIPAARGKSSKFFVLEIFDQVEKLNPYETLKLSFDTDVEAASKSVTFTNHSRKYGLKNIVITKRKKDIYIYSEEQ